MLHNTQHEVYLQGSGPGTGIGCTGQHQQVSAARGGGQAGEVVDQADQVLRCVVQKGHGWIFISTPQSNNTPYPWRAHQATHGRWARVRQVQAVQLLPLLRHC